MHVHTKVNLKHPIITAYKVDKAAQKVFQKAFQETSKENIIGSGGENQDNHQRQADRIRLQVLGRAYKFARVGC